MDTIGKRLKALRNAANLTMDAVGEHLRSKDKPDGVTKQTISAWEADRNQIGADQLLRLCKLYKVSADYVLTGKQPTKFSPETLEFAEKFEKLDADGRKKFARIYKVLQEGETTDGDDSLVPTPHPMRRKEDRTPPAGKRSDKNDGA